MMMSVKKSYKNNDIVLESKHIFYWNEAWANPKLHIKS